MNKFCNKCRKSKDISEFNLKNDRGTIRRRSYCRNCTTIQRREFAKRHPWYKTHRYINRRCKNKKMVNAHRYSGRGIENKLTLSDLKDMWFRDKAYLMKQPSIDRKNNDGDYTVENCRYIEMAENSRKSNRS